MVKRRDNSTWRPLCGLQLQGLEGERKILETLEVQRGKRK